MTNVEVGDRLLRVRQENRLSQIEFARRLGVSVGAYQGYERGERETPSSMLWALYKEFQIDPLWVLGGDAQEAVQNFRKNLFAKKEQTDSDFGKAKNKISTPSRLVYLLEEINKNRSFQNITPSIIAEAIGEPSATSIEKLFAGEADPYFEILDKISAYLGTSPYWLKHGLGQPFIIEHQSDVGRGLYERLASETAKQIIVARNQWDGKICIVINIDGLKCRTLLTDLFMNEGIGRTGIHKLAEFSVTCQKLFERKPNNAHGRHLTDEMFRQIADGAIYPIPVIEDALKFPAGNEWLADWWDISMFGRERSMEYWSGFRTLCQEVYEIRKSSPYLDRPLD
jgi:transcriptional regulator with XRE-family HTH domain